MKTWITILIIILCISHIQAMGLGISPSLLEFNQSANERECQKAILFSSSNETLIGNTAWNPDKDPITKKELKDYTSDPQSLGIIIEYPKIIQVSNKGEIDVCLKSRLQGEYYGALLYKAQTKPAAVGTWIYANISGQKPGTISKITGNFLNDPSSSNQKRAVSILLLLAGILLFSLLVLLITAKKKR